MELLETLLGSLLPAEKSQWLNAHVILEAHRFISLFEPEGCVINDLFRRQNQNMVNASCLQPDTCADSRNRVNDCNVPYNKQREELDLSSWVSCECEQDVPKRTCAHPHILRFPGAFDRLGCSTGFENGHHEIHSDRVKIIQLAEALGMHLLITCNPLDILRILTIALYWRHS